MIGPASGSDKQVMLCPGFLVEIMLRCKRLRSTSASASITSVALPSSTPSRRAWGSRRGAVRMAEETDTMLQPTQGGGWEGGCNASYKRL
jgi:hypothetical protein